MPIYDRPSFAQQESITSLLCYSDVHGKLVANLVAAELFEGDYREIAIRAIDYWHKYGKPPKLHTADLFADILEDERNPRKADAFRRILYSMAGLASEINVEYVIGDLQGFTRWQSLKGAVLAAADILQQPMTQQNIEAAERALLDVAKQRQLQFERGTRLDDDLDPFLDYLDKHHAEFTTGITALDQRGIVPARQEVFLLIGGKGRGKSWFFVHVAKRALRSGKKVLHIVLENSELETRLRYYQSLFAVPRHEADRVDLTRFKFENDKLVGLESDTATVEFDMDSPDLRSELEAHIEQLGLRAGNLIIKRFPNRTLTVEMLEGYLDRLEQIDGFVPDMVCLDYPKLMKVADNPRDFRLGLIDNSERLRALAVERNFALVIADQLTRKGHDTASARSTHIGEAWGQVHTADVTLTHSATEAEIQRGLARIFVDHSRSERDKFTVLLTQCFEIGQFVLDSCLMPSNYIDEIMPQAADDEQANESEGYDQDEE